MKHWVKQLRKNPEKWPTIFRSLRSPSRTDYEELDRKFFQALEEMEITPAREMSKTKSPSGKSHFKRGPIFVTSGAFAMIGLLISLISYGYFFSPPVSIALETGEKRAFPIAGGGVLFTGPGKGRLLEASETKVVFQIDEGSLFVSREGERATGEKQKIIWLTGATRYEMTGTVASLRVTQGNETLRVLQGSFVAVRNEIKIPVSAGEALDVAPEENFPEGTSPLPLSSEEVRSLAEDESTLLQELEKEVSPVADFPDIEDEMPPSPSPILVPAPDFAPESGETGQVGKVELSDGSIHAGILYFRGQVFYIREEGEYFRMEKRNVRRIKLKKEEK